MAQVVSKINCATEDYNTLTLWEDAKDGDLVTAQLQQTAECYNDDGNLADAVTIDGSTTDATYYMSITVPVGERHDGTEGTGFVLDAGANNSAFAIGDDYTRISWVEVTGSAQRVFYIAASNVLIHHVLAYDIDKGIEHSSGTACIVHNSIFYICADHGAYGDSGDTDAITLYNCTLLCALTDANNSLAGIVYCLAYNCGVFNFGGTSVYLDYYGCDGGSDHNISHDASADDEGANCLINKAAASQFVNLSGGSEDLHLKAGADCIDAASDLGSTYEDDIDGVARTDPWDMGADELAAGNVDVAIGAALTMTGAVQAPTPLVTQLLAALGVTGAVNSPTPQVLQLPSARTLTGAVQAPAPEVRQLLAALTATAAAQTPTPALTKLLSAVTVTSALPSPTPSLAFLASALGVTGAAQAPTPSVTQLAAALGLTVATQSPSVLYDKLVALAALTLTIQTQAPTISTGDIVAALMVILGEDDLYI